MKATISIGKYRGLQACSTPDGALAVLALDHRNNLRQALNPLAPNSVTDEDLTAFKQEVVAALAPQASAVLLDPQYGAAQCIASGALPGNVGLVVSVEASGYSGDAAARVSRMLSGFSVEKARRMGANAIKLLVYYHPEAATAGEIESFVAQVAGDCARADMPLFLEQLSYSLDPRRKTLSPEERREVVLETARRLTMPGVDFLKAEFPLDVSIEKDENAWLEACQALTKASRVPWVLLSASVDFETYLRMTEIACRAGASGVAVGRAVWKEATQLQDKERAAFLHETAVKRMRRITDLCNTEARPWTAVYAPPPIAPEWYVNYV